MAADVNAPDPENLSFEDYLGMMGLPAQAPQRPVLSPWDRAAQSVATALPNLPGPRNFGQAFASSLVGGLAGQRTRDVASREGDYQQTQKDRMSAAGDYARGLAQHRWASQRQAAEQKAITDREAAKDAADNIDLTPELAAYAKRNGIAVPTDQNGNPLVKQVKRSDLVRDLPQKPAPDPYVQELHRLQAEKMQQDMANQKQAIEDTASGIASLDANTDPRLPARDPNRNIIIALANKKLKEAGSPFNVRLLQQMRDEADRVSKTLDNQRFMGFRQSASTTKQHLEQFKEFYDKYSHVRPPADLRVLGKGTYQLALEGLLGAQAQEDATGLKPIADALPLEIATTIAGGRAPYESEVKHAATSFVSPWLNKRSTAAQLASTEELVRARVNSFLNSSGYSGWEKNPYLMKVSPLYAWDEINSDKDAAGASQAPSKGGGKAGKWGQ